MKAKLIKSLRINGQLVAPKDGRVTLVELDKKEFDRLEDMGKVLKPSDDDLKIGHLVGQPVEEAEVVEQTSAPKTDSKSGKQSAQKSSTGNDTKAGGSDPDLNI